MTVEKEVLKTLTISNTLGEVNEGSQRTHTFNVDFSNIVPEFKGSFTVHHPSMMERLAIGRLYAQLTGGLPVDNHTDNISTIISTLDVVIDSKPKWFNVNDVRVDYSMMETVYLEYVDWMNTFRQKAEGDSTKGDSAE